LVKEHLQTVILEYNSVWMVPGERLTVTGLNRYKSGGVGMPFEVEPGILMKFCHLMQLNIIYQLEFENNI
jgi:hypothetical protein